MARLLLNWEKHKQGIQLCYDTYNQTKKHFAIPGSTSSLQFQVFLVSIDASEKSFFIKFF